MDNRKKEFIRKEDVDKQIRRTKSEFESEIEGLVGRKEYQNFKAFAFKGEMVQLAIAFILGAAFKTAVSGLSNNIIMPFLNYIIAKTGTDWREQTWEPVNGMIFKVGEFAGAFIDFFLIAIVLYIVFTKVLKPLVEEDEKKTVKCIEVTPCPQCQTQIHWKATRCPHCTSWVDGNINEL